MTDTTPRVGAPLLAASQAQKSVTHNEALYQFDAFLCARFISRTLATPPSSPADGDAYLIATGGSGTWLGQDGNIAYCADGAWRFYAPFAGLSAYVTAENVLIVYSGSAWCDFASLIAMQDLPMVGVNTTADSTNKLSVKSNAVLFADLATGSGGTGDIRATLSKQASGNTASFLFQDAFSGRAEIGLTGDDNFHFKVSPDGSTWHDAMDIAASTGSVSIASAAINGGTMDNTAIGATTPSPAKFTTLQATAAVTHTPSNANVTLSPTGSGKVVVAPATAGTMDNMAVGQTTAAAGKFTTLQATGTATFADGSTWSSSGVTVAGAAGGFLLGGYTGTQATVSRMCVATNGSTGPAMSTYVSATVVRTHLSFENGNGIVGSISTSGSAAAFNTSSDRRLKENFAPLVAGAAIDALAPVAFTWKADGSAGAGFIADELQAVVPQAVTGDAGAVDGRGKPIYQSVDHSKLVPYLAAAIKELRARVAALEN